jgi:hypothetical protein
MQIQRRGSTWGRLSEHELFLCYQKASRGPLFAASAAFPLPKTASKASKASKGKRAPFLADREAYLIQEWTCALPTSRGDVGSCRIRGDAGCSSKKDEIGRRRTQRQRPRLQQPSIPGLKQKSYWRGIPYICKRARLAEVRLIVVARHPVYQAQYWKLQQRPRAHTR